MTEGLVGASFKFQVAQIGMGLEMAQFTLGYAHQNTFCLLDVSLEVEVARTPGITNNVTKSGEPESAVDSRLRWRKIA